MAYQINPKDFAALNGTKIKRAKANIHHAANWIIGGWENTQLDHKEGTEEWQQATNALADHQGLVDEIYYEATTNLYDEGFCGWGPEVERALKDIRFLGKDFILGLVEKEVIAQGY